MSEHHKHTRYRVPVLAVNANRQFIRCSITAATRWISGVPGVIASTLKAGMVMKVA